MIFIILQCKNLEHRVNIYGFHCFPMQSNEHYIYIYTYIYIYLFTRCSMFLWFQTILVVTAFPYRLPRISLQITKPFHMDYQGFASILLGLCLQITKPFPMDYQAFPYRSSQKCPEHPEPGQPCKYVWLSLLFHKKTKNAL